MAFGSSLNSRICLAASATGACCGDDERICPAHRGMISHGQAIRTKARAVCGMRPEPTNAPRESMAGEETSDDPRIRLPTAPDA